LILQPRVAGITSLWQSALVRHRVYQRWSVVLGMLAMLGAIVAMPLSSTYALAMATSNQAMAEHTAAMKHDMPCHKPAKPCPECPQKVCPEMGTCLVKCFQPLASPVGEMTVPGDVVSARVRPAVSQVSGGFLIPPLLRPPSV